MTPINKISLNQPATNERAILDIQRQRQHKKALKKTLERQIKRLSARQKEKNQYNLFHATEANQTRLFSNSGNGNPETEQIMAIREDIARIERDLDRLDREEIQIYERQANKAAVSMNLNERTTQ